MITLAKVIGFTIGLVVRASFYVATVYVALLILKYLGAI